MENNLRNTFKQKYDRKQWQSVLIKIMGDDNVNYSLTPKSIALTDTQLLKIEKVLNIGTILTSDKKELPVFEIHLKPTVIIERNRVTVNEIIKQYLIKDARDGAIAVFYYPDYKKTEWRFSFISPGSENSFFEELEIESTNSKRYSYVFGVAEEEHRTAARQFNQLSESKKTLNDFFEAFNVEKMSKEFFDEYKEQYLDFIQFITGTRIVNQKEQVVHNPHKYFITVFGSDKKRVRDFMKKLLGRIIFLYFIQKKGWLGASSNYYKDGDKNFLQNLFNQATDEAFYPNWLSKLFFDTLNKKRDDDNFEMPDGSIVKIPFLNGGLFDKVNTKYDWLTFSPSLFQDLFHFMNRYNFTIYEDSPDDHTVAVDPEMLGHIFENLLEDNKDKGAFYTPKEIVQYMTQESLIEYLHSHLPTLDKKYLILLVRYKSLDNIQVLKDKISDIDYLLDKVKICDPAIGSGAFPMGLLQEIFALKDLLMHEKGFDISDKARVKEHIIQNSIYGVDIEQGAVDIARLRFWLSLVVYEDIPKPLPNLDFKIVVGDSLLTKFEDQILHIDWEVKSAKTGKMIAADIRKELSQLTQKQKEYFESSNKAILNKEIRELKLGIIEKQIRFNQLQYNEYNSVQGNIFEGKLKRSAKHETEVQNFGLLLNKITSLRANPDKELQFFDWKLNFPEVLNPAIALDNSGFDIVIGNPPWGAKFDKLTLTEIKSKNEDIISRMTDSFMFFVNKSIQISKKHGIITNIIPEVILNQQDNALLRNKIIELCQINNIVNLGDGVFYGVTRASCILQLRKDSNPNFQYVAGDFKKVNGRIQFLNTYSIITSDILENLPFNIFPSKDIDLYKIYNKIKHTKTLSSFLDEDGIQRGISPDYKDAFILSTDTIIRNNLEVEYLRKTVTGGKDVKKYLYNTNDKHIIYTTRNTETINIPNILDYILEFSDKITCTEVKEGKHPIYSLHRPRVEKIFTKKSKLMGVITGDKLILAHDSKQIYPTDGIYVLSTSNLKKDKALMALLNSKLATVIYRLFSNEEGKTLAQIKPNVLNNIPIPVNLFGNIDTFSIISEYIEFLKNDLSEKGINEYVPNNHIAETFEEVIDAMVFELYFPDDFKKANINFIEYAERDFRSIEGLEDSDKKEVIHQAYQTLREKHNEIRNNLKLMDIRLADIVMPIKNA